MGLDFDDSSSVVAGERNNVSCFFEGIGCVFIKVDFPLGFSGEGV